jgi:hypothetical protein
MQIFKHSPVIVFYVSVLVSCGGKDKNGEREKIDTTQKAMPRVEYTGDATRLEGAWEIKRAEGSMAETNLGTVYIFNRNTLSFGKGDFLNPGKTEVTDSTFSFQANGNEYIFMYNYKFNGDTLVVEMQKGMGQVFHMVKK